MSIKDDIRYMPLEQRIAEGWVKAPEPQPAEPVHPRAYLESLSVEALRALVDEAESAAERSWARKVLRRKEQQ